MVTLYLNSEIFPSTQAAAKDQDEKKPEATKKKAYSLVCTACEGNGKPAVFFCLQFRLQGTQPITII